MNKSYWVVRCERCGVFLLALAGRKTRLCPRCGKRINLLRARKWLETEDASLARAYVEVRNKLGAEVPEDEVVKAAKELVRGRVG